MPLNANPEKSDKNWYSGGSQEKVMEKYQGLLPEKIRKNAVLAVEILMTASPEFKGSWVKYLNASQAWAREIFGKENQLHVTQHFDETTPHTHIIFIPKKDGKLNAKYFIGGTKFRMEELQTDFYEKVGRPHQLDRGVSKAETKAKNNPASLAKKAADLDAQERDLKNRENKISDMAVEIKTAKDEILKVRGKTTTEISTALSAQEKYDRIKKIMRDDSITDKEAFKRIENITGSNRSRSQGQGR
jgi:hypothetical protein